MKLYLLLINLTICLMVSLSGCTDRNDSYDHDIALRRVLTVQQLQNLKPGDPSVVPQIEAIIDSMGRSGKDACYFGAVNVLIDRLFSDGRYAESDSLAVRMQREAYEESDSLAISMAKRVRAQLLYKLSQPDRALKEALSALPFVKDPLRSGSHFGTLTSLDEWLHIIAGANSDTSIMTKAGDRYAETVELNIIKNSWKDPSGHFPVTALAFKAENAYLKGMNAETRIMLDSATAFINKDLPARAYEHFYDIRSRFQAAQGDFAGAIGDIDTLLQTHQCFPWFYLRDLKLKAEIQHAAGLHEESAKTYSRYIAYHDSLSSRLTDSRLHDLTVLYRTELDREERRMNTMRLIGLGSVSLFLLILFGVTLRHAITERKRNRLLVERLHEYDRAEIHLIRKHQQKAESQEEPTQIGKLDRFMIDEQPFTDPGLGRKELADAIGITQDALAMLIRTERDCSVHAYINSFRIEEARRVLDSDSQESIAEIASRLGFGTPRTLQRAFKERFDMTPTQYRDAAKDINFNNT